MVFWTLNECPQHHYACPFHLIDVDVQKTSGDGKLFVACSNASARADKQTDPLFPVAVNKSAGILLLDGPQLIALFERQAVSLQIPWILFFPIPFLGSRCAAVIPSTELLDSAHVTIFYFWVTLPCGLACVLSPSSRPVVSRGVNPSASHRNLHKKRIDAAPRKNWHFVTGQTRDHVDSPVRIP